MPISRPWKIVSAIFASLLSLLVVAAIVLVNFDWNRIKPWLGSRASEALDRPLTIGGDLSLSWGHGAEAPEANAPAWHDYIPWPQLIAKDVRIGNPVTMSAAPDSEFARVRSIGFSLNPFALLQHKISIPLLRFDAPELKLLRTIDGHNNWTIKEDESASQWHLDLHKIEFAKGSIHLVDAVRNVDLTADIDTISGDPLYGMAWKVHGKYNGDSVSGNGRAGAVLSLTRQTEPYPLMATLHAGQTAISFTGTLTRPTDLAAIDMRFKISGASMAQLYHLSGLVLPETKPYAVDGQLHGTLGAQGAHWRYEQFRGRMGESDLGGTLDFITRNSRGLLSGTVVSRSLLFTDLAPLIGADSEASKVKRGDTAVHQPDSKALPVAPFKSERWTSIDTDVHFSADKIIRPEALPIDKLDTRIRLQDGVLSLAPLDFGIAGGTLKSNITLDGSGHVERTDIKATMTIAARSLDVKKLFPTLETLQASAGHIDGDARLTAVGHSVASLLGSANGEIKAQIDQGSVSKLLLEKMGLNVGNVVLVSVLGDKQVKLNCLASDFAVSNGVMQARSFVVDTDAAVLDITGNIDMSREQLDLRIKPNSTGIRIFSLRTPLMVHGSFKSPVVSFDKGAMALKAGAAIGLAIVAPIAALIPLTNIGARKESVCPQLLAAAKVTPVAPPPGKTLH